MLKLRNPKWLFFTNSIPILILIAISFGQFQVFKSLLDETQYKTWIYFLSGLTSLLIFNFVYALFLNWKNKSVPIWFVCFTILSHILFLYLFGYHMHQILPRSIPPWMVSDNIGALVFGFLMPTIGHALFLLVAEFTSPEKHTKPWRSFLYTIAIPILGYIFTQLIFPIWKPQNDQFLAHVIVVTAILFTLIFLFFLIRFIYILSQNSTISFRKYELIWKLPIAILFPLAGLALNNGLIFDYFYKGEGVFGNFQNIWFYILAFINGLLLCFPNSKLKNFHIWLFFLRSLTFAYTLYFFLVFLPYLPLSIFAIIVFGVGFLMLTPLLLFVIHINQLQIDYEGLKKTYSQVKLTVLFSIAFLTIPSIITVQNLFHRQTLHTALEYLNHPDYSKKYDPSIPSLRNTLDAVVLHRKDSRNSIFNVHTPFLTAYFQWIVLDNLTLSNQNLNLLSQIYLNKNIVSERPFRDSSTDVKITKLNQSSKFDERQGFWKSQIDLEITNQTNNPLAEYITSFELPTGAWITDYYLYVNGKKEQGILAEKKSALWVYSNILNENRDPGILYYQTGNKIIFRVFPFAKKEIRKTGFELIHRENLKFQLEGNSIQLGKPIPNQILQLETENFIYVSKEKKRTLNKVYRIPNFHFLVDTSEGKKELKEPYKKRLSILKKEYPSLFKNAKISFVNSQIKTIPFSENWENDFLTSSFEGGFFLGRGIETALIHSFQTKNYEVLVSITDNPTNSIFSKDLADWEFLFPESSIFYFLNEDGQLIVHSLKNNPKAPTIKSKKPILSLPVLEYPMQDQTIQYISVTEEPSIILKQDNFSLTKENESGNQWLIAIYLQAKWNTLLLHPETTKENWIPMIQKSFSSKVMIPYTSYLVVENEAQKAALKKKQEEILNSNKSLDPGNTAQRMSEPNIMFILLLFGPFLWNRLRRKN
ncbi:MAG: MSEP-CTERM sorting domain-containing protein [Leptospira sp.]|nr:MSEP-CTERM sorting domain-containing protein [Leptospira sp.]